MKQINDECEHEVNITLRDIIPINNIYNKQFRCNKCDKMVKFNIKRRRLDFVKYFTTYILGTIYIDELLRKWFSGIIFDIIFIPSIFIVILILILLINIVLAIFSKRIGFIIVENEDERV